MALDASALQDIQGPDVTGSIAKGFQLKDMIDQNQLNQLKLASATQEADDKRTQRKILSGSDISTEKGSAEAQEKLNKAGLTQQAMELRKYTQQITSGEIDNQIQKIQLADKALDWSASQFDPIYQKASAMRSQMVTDPRTGKPRPQYTEAEINAYIQSQAPTVLKNLQDADDSVLPPQYRQMALQKASQGGGPRTFDDLQRIEDQSAKQRELHKQQLEQLNIKSQIADRDAGKAETARHNRVEEGQGAQRLAIAKQNSGDFGGANGELLAAMTDAGVTLPQGLRSKQVLAGTLTALRERHPEMTPDQIAAGVKDGSIAMGVAKTEGSVLGRREAAILPVEKSITKPGGFLDQAEQAVNEVDFSKLKAAGQFENWKADQLSDPKLAAYKAAVAELRAEYSIVLSKGGQVTDAARHESEKVIPDLITKDQFKRIKQVVLKGIESSKGGVEESIGQVTGGKTPPADSKTDPLGIR